MHPAHRAARVARFFVSVALLAGATACGGPREWRPFPVLPPASAPDSVATAFFTALAEERWHDAAAHLDLHGFEAYRRSVVDQRDAFEPAGLPTVKQLMEADVTMSRAVAEHRVRELARYRRAARSSPLAAFAGVPTLDSLARLSPTEAAARWLRARDRRWQLQVLRDPDSGECLEGGRPVEDTYGLLKAAPNVIVTTAIRDTVAWVLHYPVQSRGDDYGEPVNGALGEWYRGPNYVTFLELRRRPDAWRIVPHAEMLVIGSYSGGELRCLPEDLPQPARNATR